MKNKDINTIQQKKVSLKPYIYKKPSISAVTIRIMILLSLQVIMLVITKSYSALWVVLASALGTSIANFIHYLFTKKQSFSYLTAIIQGLMIGMLLPETYPPLYVLLISMITILIYKYIFEDSENFWVNIVSVAVLFAFFIGKNYFPDFVITRDLFSSKNASALLIQNGSFPIYDFDVSITEYLNSNILSHVKVTLPEGYISLLWDAKSIIPAFRFNLLTIIASIVLFSDNSFSSLIPGLFLLVYAGLVRIFFPFMNGGELYQGDILLAILTSGTLYIAVFMIQWFGTHPMSLVGKIIYAVLAGVFAFFIVGCGTSPIGMVYVIIICNIVNLLIRQIEEIKVENKITKIANTKIVKDR